MTTHITRSSTHLPTKWRRSWRDRSNHENDLLVSIVIVGLLVFAKIVTVLF